ncbi:MAG: hypothetical protein KGQ54_01495 [Verrucomicrobia bacterium]|nr:hypothetical protein [Verrucomicrobiota bacterium]
MARSLSDQYGLKFIDLDEVLEGRFSLSIREIFIKLGEQQFRELEHKVFQELLDLDFSILSVGGGFRIAPSVSRYQILWIRVPFKVVYNRLNLDAPYLKSRSVEHFIKEREDFYQSVANLEIELTGIDLKYDTYCLWEAIVSANRSS